MKSYFINTPPFKEVAFTKHGFCQYPAPFSFPNPWKKQAHLTNLQSLKTLEDGMAKDSGKSV